MKVNFYLNELKYFVLYYIISNFFLSVLLLHYKNELTISFLLRFIEAFNNYQMPLLGLGFKTILISLYKLPVFYIIIHLFLSAMGFFLIYLTPYFTYFEHNYFKNLLEAISFLSFIFGIVILMLIDIFIKFIINEFYFKNKILYEYAVEINSFIEIVIQCNKALLFSLFLVIVLLIIFKLVNTKIHYYFGKVRISLFIGSLIFILFLLPPNFGILCASTFILFILLEFTFFSFIFTLKLINL